MYYEKITSRKWPWLMGTMITIVVLGTTVGLLVYFLGPGAKTTIHIPPLKPPIQDSVPSGFSSVARILQQQGDFTFHGQLKDRFFHPNQEGPTNVYNLVQMVDTRVDSINKRSAEGDERECLTKEPIEITLEGWPGETLTMWLQCYEQMNDDFFIMFGKKGDTFYLYEGGSMVKMAAFIHTKTQDREDAPCCYQVSGGGDTCSCDDNDQCSGGAKCRTRPTEWPWPTVTTVGQRNTTGDSDLPDVSIYFSVGAAYAPSQTGSRGLMHLEARPRANVFEAAAAGIGLGFCGVQFASDGDKIRFKGSMDAPGGGCHEVETTCVSSDLSTNYDDSLECSTIPFSVAPLGRKVSEDFLGNLGLSRWNASSYPGGASNGVEISDLTTASVHFGPRTAPPQLTKF
jgi:hypothetical protein